MLAGKKALLTLKSVSDRVTHDEFLARLAVEYPQAVKEAESFGGIKELVIPTLIAPEALSLPCALWNEAQRLVSIFHSRIRENQNEAERLRALTPALQDPGHYSVLMSYDFHVDPSGALRLIEINTNASMGAMVDVMNATRGLERARNGFALDFQRELGRELKGARIAIVDDEPSKQKLFAEFLVYKDMLMNCGAEVVIADRRELSMRQDHLWCGDFGPIDLVYNRATDFYLEENSSLPLREALAAKATVITPSAHEYRLLADKNRMVRWSEPGALESIGLSADECAVVRRALIQTREVRGLDPELLWNERKNLIFKPKNAFGGKAVFRGSSVARGVFQRILEADGLAQEFVPAPTVAIGGVEFKYDLRFFAYRDELRTACARLYQGQMTNATTPGGGVTSVIWT